MQGTLARMRVPRPAALSISQAAVERRQPVGQAAQAAAQRGVRAADAVVGDLDERPAVLARRRGPRRGWRARTWRRSSATRRRRSTPRPRPRPAGDPSGSVDDLDRQRRAVGERLERRPEARGRSAPPGGCRGRARAGPRAPARASARAPSSSSGGPRPDRGRAAGRPGRAAARARRAAAARRRAGRAPGAGARTGPPRAGAGASRAAPRRGRAARPSRRSLSSASAAAFATERDELGLVAQRAVVHERRRRRALALDLRRRAGGSSVGGQLDLAGRPRRRSGRLLDPVGDLQASGRRAPRRSASRSAPALRALAQPARRARPPRPCATRGCACRPARNANGSAAKATSAARLDDVRRRRLSSPTTSSASMQREQRDHRRAGRAAPAPAPSGRAGRRPASGGRARRRPTPMRPTAIDRRHRVDRRPPASGWSLMSERVVGVLAGAAVGSPG